MHELVRAKSKTILFYIRAWSDPSTKALNDEERKTIYTMLDAFIGKKKLKDALSNVLHDVH